MGRTDNQKLNKVDKGRLSEIISVLKKHEVQKGLTPEKLRMIFEDLGPTFVKVGQILSMRPELIPPEYCQELGNLRTDVAPMPKDELIETINEELGSSFEDVFKEFDYTPIGSASIAQVHKAVLMNGEPVAVKVQRRNIYKIMERDIRLIRKLDGFVKLSYIGKFIDLNMILDELWASAKQEMDFLIEASNLIEFAENNRNIVYVCCPKVYRELSTERLLIMEFSTGVRIDDKEALSRLGYDIAEIGRKLVSNYIKQVIDDRFFQADPHPGNIYISNGKIVWLDMGMMCRITEYDAHCYRDILNAVIDHDYVAMKDAILAMGICTERVDEDSLLYDVEKFVGKYEKFSLNEINLAVAMTEAIDLAARYKVRMPAGVTMLARGMGTIEGLLEIISPDVSIISILAVNHAHMAVGEIDLKKETVKLLKDLLESGRDMAKIPAQVSDVIDKVERGKLKISVESSNTEKINAISNSAKKIAAGLVSGFIILASAIIYNGQSEGHFIIGIIGFAIGLVLAGWTILSEKKK